MALDFQNPTPLYQQIANEIRSEVASGKLKPGDPIGSHQSLADKFGVSLITIRKARAQLINEGVLYTRIGKGTYVAEKTTKVDFTKHRTIGFVLRDLESPFFSKILTSVEKYLSEKNYNLLISSTANRSEQEESQIENFLQMGVHGLVIASMSRQYQATPAIRRLNENGFPYAVVSYIADKDICYVGIDHKKGGYLATRHLLELGYRRIAYINGKVGSVLGDIRKAGYLSALKDFNVKAEPDLIFHLRQRGEWFDYESGYEIGEQFCKLKNMPEAVFAYNDLAALGFEKAILDCGRRVPHDVAIVGFDDIKRSRVAPVPLTTVHQPTEKIGEMAVKIILSKIEGIKIDSCKNLVPSLIVRDSCGSKYLEQIANKKLGA